MVTFTDEDAKHRLDEVFSAAESAVVEITSRGRPLVRIMSIQQADELSSEKIQHDVLDDMRHRIGCEVLSRFPLSVVRERSRDNLRRWRAQGVWSESYEEWLQILESSDDVALVSFMIGFDENCYRLRQSMPYVGILEQSLVQKIHAGRSKLP